MKSYRVFALALAVAGGLAAAPPPTKAAPTKEAKIAEILKLTHSEKMADQAIEQVKAVMASQIPATQTPENRAKAVALQAKMIDLIRARMNYEKLRPEYVKIFAEAYTDSEVDGLLAFYRSPAGRATVEKMPVVMTKTMMLVQSMMRDMMPEVMRLAQEAEKKPQ